MKEYAENLHKEMMQDVSHCKNKSLYFDEEVECCFLICKRYWTVLKEKLLYYEFENEQQEIDFFKNVKPLFTSEIEYYNLLYHSQLFKPLGNHELKDFWKRESQRLEKFKEENDGFYQYYKNGQTGKDKDYFLRVNNDFYTNLQKAKVYDLDERSATSHDHLVATLLALERYGSVAKQQLAELENNR